MVQAKFDEDADGAVPPHVVERIRVDAKVLADEPIVLLVQRPRPIDGYREGPTSQCNGLQHDRFRTRQSMNVSQRRKNSAITW